MRDMINSFGRNDEKDRESNSYLYSRVISNTCIPLLTYYEAD